MGETISLPISPQAFNDLMEAEADPKDTFAVQAIEMIKTLYIDEISKMSEKYPQLIDIYNIPNQKKIVTVTPRTQKGLGVEALCKESFGFRVQRPVVFHTKEDEHLNNPETMEHILKYRLRASAGDYLFIRYCPKTPRHGFIDSYRYKFSTTSALVKELKKSLDVLYQVDPEGEIMLMKYIDAAFSAVMTPGKLAIGDGHDGATAGRDVTTVAMIAQMFPQVDKKKFGIKKDEEPYFELVFPKDGSDPYAVQVRSGPAISGFSGNEWIPKKITVKEVINVSNQTNLIEWQETMEKKRGQDGVVVYHKGGGISSHWSAHAIMNGIPVFLLDAPVIGVTYNPTTESAGFTKRSLEGFIEGLKAGLAAEISQKHNGYQQHGSKECEAAVYAAHGGALWHSHGEAKLLGIGSALMWRVSAAACIGEHRYKSAEVKSEMGSSRDLIYTKAFKSIKDSIQRTRKSLDSFASDSWGGGYGGIRWAECNAYTIDLEHEIQVALSTPIDLLDPQDTINKFLKIMHGVINISHNCGKFLTKYVSGSYLDNVSSGGTHKIITATKTLMDISSAVKPAQSVLSGFLKVERPPSKVMKFWKSGKWVVPKSGQEEVEEEEIPTGEKTEAQTNSLHAQFREIEPHRIRIQVHGHLEYTPPVQPKKPKKVKKVLAPTNIAKELGLIPDCDNETVEGVEKSGHYESEFNTATPAWLVKEFEKYKKGESNKIGTPTRPSLYSGASVMYFSAEIDTIDLPTKQFEIYIKDENGKKLVIYKGKVSFTYKGE